MFEYNDELKKLPILDEKVVKDRYKKLVKVLLTEDEFNESEKTIDSFFKEGASGFILHKSLLEHCQKADNRSWLYDLWLNMYLEYRAEIAINVNYYAVLKNQEFKDELSHAQILAIAIHSMTKLYFSIIDESLPAEKRRDTAICMKNYEHILGATRIADYEKDDYLLKNKNKESNHVIFIYKGYMYKVLVSDNNAIPYSPASIEKTIRSIIYDVNQADESENIGIITSAKRDKAAFLSKKLKHSLLNTENFNCINEAIAVFCLDDKCKHSTDFTEDFLISNGINRYFDKSTQVILTEDKEIGINNEHSHADASLYSLVLSSLYHNLISYKEILSEENLTKVPYRKLTWETKSDTKIQIRQTIKEHQKHAASKYTKDSSFYNFGKNKIKEYKISPDAFFHLALQLAQYRSFGSLRSTYEAIDMREYREGRTECTRPLNEDSKKFAQNFDVLNDKKNTHEIKTLLDNAIKSHGSNIKDIKNGYGIERYLFGLEEMNQTYIKDTLANRFFSDTAYKRLKEDFLSTSNFGGEHIKAFGFGNVHRDGYGIGYSVNSEHIAITISSDIKNKEKSEELIENLHQSLQDIKCIYEEYK